MSTTITHPRAYATVSGPHVTFVTLDGHAVDLASALRNEEEPELPPWRSADFTPPLNPLVARAG